MSLQEIKEELSRFVDWYSENKKQIQIYKVK